MIKFNSFPQKSVFGWVAEGSALPLGNFRSKDPLFHPPVRFFWPFFKSLFYKTSIFNVMQKLPWNSSTIDFLLSQNFKSIGWRSPFLIEDKICRVNLYEHHATVFQKICLLPARFCNKMNRNFDLQIIIIILKLLNNVIL